MREPLKTLSWLAKRAFDVSRSTPFILAMLYSLFVMTLPTALAYFTLFEHEEMVANAFTYSYEAVEAARASIPSDRVAAMTCKYIMMVLATVFILALLARSFFGPARK